MLYREIKVKYNFIHLLVWICYSFTEEERHLRANDRPFNLSYHYAVSVKAKFCAEFAFN